MTKLAFMTAANVQASLIATGRPNDGGIVRLIAWACLSERVIASGIKQVTIGQNTDARFERQIIDSRLWRFFDRAFANNAFHRSTMLEEDWRRGSFRYRVERDEGEERPPLEVTCFLDWEVGKASFAFDTEDGKHVQSVWRSILFDAPSIEALCQEIAPKEKRSRATKYHWPDFTQEALRLMRSRGPFSADWTQSDCERLMLNWCQHLWGQEPAESTIRDKVKAAELEFLADAKAD